MYNRGRREAIKIAEGVDRRGHFWTREVIVTRRGIRIFHLDRLGTFRTMPDPEQGGNQRAAIAGLAITVLLLAAGLWLAHELAAGSKMQDCLMSGRTNCNTIEAPAR